MLKIVALVVWALSLAPAVSAHSQHVLKVHDAPDVDGSAPPFSTANRIFNSVQGLTKTWDQSWAPVGRAVIPAVVNNGVRLWHGGIKLPTGREWLAFDAEQAWGFGNLALEGEHTTLWTIETRRDLKVLLFDGTSSAKTSTGHRHTHQLLADGKPCDRPGEPPCSDSIAQKLCDLDIAKHLDGFIRLEATYELLLCDWSDTSAYEVVSDVSFSARYRAPRDVPPWSDPDRLLGLPYVRSMFASHYLASRSQGNGDQRITPIANGMLSLYDEDDYPSLAESNRRSIYNHGMEDISQADIKTFDKEIEQIVADWSEGSLGSSGLKWQVTTQQVVDRYGVRLAELLVILSEDSSVANDELALAHRVVQVLHTILFRYIDAPIVLEIWPKKSLAEPILASLEHSKSLCRSDFPTGDRTKFSKQEKRIATAITTVLDRICSTTIDTFGQALLAEREGRAPTGAIDQWRRSISKLLDWLAWPSLQRCERQCGWDEVCWHKAWYLTIRESTTPYDDIPEPRCVKLNDIRMMIVEGLISETDP